MKLAVKIVDSFEEALDHVAKYGSNEEAIISEEASRAETSNQVDAAPFM